MEGVRLGVEGGDKYLYDMQHIGTYVQCVRVRMCACVRVCLIETRHYNVHRPVPSWNRSRIINWHWIRVYYTVIVTIFSRCTGLIFICIAI